MSVVDFAVDEMRRANYTGEERETMRRILTMFFNQWDSGGAVAAMFPVLQRLIAGKPLGPLTGADDEWNDVGEQNGSPLWQNRRTASVFKDNERAWDIDLGPRGPDGKWLTITFPYMPGQETAKVDWPIVSF